MPAEMGPADILSLEGGRELHGDHLLVATRRRPRVPAGLETVGVQAGPQGIGVDAHLRAGERLWAVGDVTGVRLLTHVGKYQGEVVAANILGEPREANYEAIPDVVYTDPQAAAVGAMQAQFSATALVYSVYNGYWFWGRLSFEDLRRDLREVTREIRPDWDLAAPGLRENWEAGDHSMHHLYRADHDRSPSAAGSPSAVAVPGGA